ncbi:MAG: GNAT family N-acetyltransferase, partial [Gemmatimonadetes bacterium]|nr:GNAT family N-acetyltransferase [Gemmatimonadota bacterium]
MLRAAGLADATAIAVLHAASWRFAYRDALSAAYLAGDIVPEREALWTARLGRPLPTQRVIVAEGPTLLGFACLFL